MSQQVKPVMIVGGNFFGRGAEAMLLTVRRCLGEREPGAVFCVYNTHRSQVQPLLDAGFVPVAPRKLSRPMRLASAVGTVLGLSPRSAVPVTAGRQMELANPFRAAGATVDISGFVSGSMMRTKGALARWRAFHMARQAGNKIIFMPQTWGPFQTRGVRFFTRRLIADADLVFAREPKSMDYLTQLVGHSQKIVFAHDIAFQFKPSERAVGLQILGRLGLAGDEPIIGITPNMRIYERTSGEGPQNSHVAMLRSLIERLLGSSPARVVLIPHEVYQHKKDDLWLAEQLKGCLPDSLAGRVAVLSEAISAADLKSVIGCLEFLVASRYHSLVAALSQRVAVAVVGWAHKYDELMRDVGIEQYVIDPVNRPGQEGIEVIVQAWDRREQLRQAARDNVPRLERSSADALSRSADLISQSGASQ